MRESKLIFLTSDSPFPPSGSDKAREVNLIQLLSEQMEVEVICHGPESSVSGITGSSFPEIEGDSGEQNDKHLIQVTQVERLPKRILWSENALSSAIVAILKSRAAGTAKIIWISKLKMAKYIPIARSLGYRVIFDEPIAKSSKHLSLALLSMQRWTGVLTSARTAYHEERFCSASHAVVTGSEIDASRLKKLVPEVPIYVIPAAVDTSQVSAFRNIEGGNLFTYANLNSPGGLESLRWFAKEVLPKLKAHYGNRPLPRIVVSGNQTLLKKSSLLQRNKTIDFLRATGLAVYPEPRSVLTHLSEAAVVFFPIQAGPDMRYRILESMAAAKPVVATGRAALGLVLSPTYDIYIADRADSFASALVRLLRDPVAREEIGMRAAKTAREKYDWRCSRGVLDGLLSSIDL